MLYSYGGFGRLVMGNDDVQDNLNRLRQELDTADSVIIGAGSVLSTAAGYIYTGGPFERYFGDFGAKYGFKDMYSGGFYPYQTPEEMWAFWSRHIYINRYAPIPTDLYDRLLHLVENKDYFVLTTNVDHCFQRAGFDKQRLFYTQGDYGLFQSSRSKRPLTYDNERFPVLTFITNILGALLIGFIAGLTESRNSVSPHAVLFWKTGVCGGFTTFSTFSLESYTLLQNKKYLLGSGYMLLSVVCCLIGVLCGRRLAMAVH